MQLLDARSAQQRTFLCCGLDPDVARLPIDIIEKTANKEEAIFRFLTEFIDISVDYASAYKAQKAFYDLHDGGHRILREIINYIHVRYPEVPVFVDCKIGDIDNTMQSYLGDILGSMKADGVVVNPYMGDEVIKPFAKAADKACIVLVRTSNPGSAITQELLLENGLSLWQHILSLVVERWNTAGNMIPVLAATHPNINWGGIRKSIPDTMPVLIAGFGAQGGTLSNISDLLNSNGTGILINSSRALMYPFIPTDRNWREAIRDNVRITNQNINQVLRQSGIDKRS